MSNYENQIKVIHKIRNKQLPNTFYVGRPTALGNPFTVYKTTNHNDIQVGSILEAVQEYEVYFEEELEAGNEQMIAQLEPIFQALTEGKTVHLACWCKDEVTPFASDSEYCHSDVIRNFLLDELEAEE